MQKIPLTDPLLGNVAPNFIQKNVNLADKNWFGTGGPAHFYAEPKNITSFKEW